MTANCAFSGFNPFKNSGTLSIFLVGIKPKEVCYEMVSHFPRSASVYSFVYNYSWIIAKEEKK